MDDQSSHAERVPAIYRAIIDAAWELERRGQRGEALQARRRAARAYLRWDAKAERRLQAVLDGATRDVARESGISAMSRVGSRLHLRARSGSLARRTA